MEDWSREMINGRGVGQQLGHCGTRVACQRRAARLDNCTADIEHGATFHIAKQLAICKSFHGNTRQQRAESLINHGVRIGKVEI